MTVDRDTDKLLITAWVCDVCGYWRKDKQTGVHMATNPSDPNGPMLRHNLRKATFQEVSA